MKNMNINGNADHFLVPVTEQYLRTLHLWHQNEKDFEKYTCRPVNPVPPFEEYAAKALASNREGREKAYILVSRKDNNRPLGKISLFDFNPRNHSAEFGYFLPAEHRGQGIGTIMLNLFIEEVFSDQILGLNKIYATTSSHNVSSIRLLEKFGFVFEGRQREHYWVGDQRFDQVVYSMLRREYFV